MPDGFPKRLIIGSGTSARSYRVAGTEAKTPRWQTTAVPSQSGDPMRERTVPLGDGIAGIVGSHRHGGSPAGVADVVNGDTSVQDHYGAGPGVTTISLPFVRYHAAGSIGGSLSIGGGGAPSVGAGPLSGTPTAIWADGYDTSGERTRYIYVLAGSRLQVIDPTDDSVGETTEWDGISGGDHAFWAGSHWIARRGSGSDFVQYVTTPYQSGGATVLAEADYTATHLAAGPDALYRSYTSAGNAALIKKTDSTTAAAVDNDSNWAPSAGETMGDPGVGITRLAVLGGDLVAGKRTGLYEFDRAFNARVALDWMKAFEWSLNCNAILPVGQNREVIVAFRRGLYYLPLNKSIGTEALAGNETDKKGRYTALAYDGNWIYAFLESRATDDTHLIKMRPRQTPGPGLFEHHPVATLTDKQVLTAYIWPGCTVSGTVYGPRLYFGYGSDAVGYIRLGETQPDSKDSNYRFTTGAWSIQWPHDDFGTPATPKIPYKVEADHRNVAGTSGITWAVSVNDGASFVNMDSDGSGSGTAAVTANGFAQRFGRRDNSVTGREIIFRVSGTGGSATAQQAVVGTPIVTVLEQPEMVTAIDCTLQLERTTENDEDGEQQWRTLLALAGDVLPCIAEWGDDAPDTTFYARILPPERTNTIPAAGAPGVILAHLAIRALDFS